ncbi:MAG TPA: tetratricopeptide repeat protein [Blastocatellia bacterium]|nr:tetratricopeptide repeat protein [Blastocatellia bacterium]
MAQTHKKKKKPSVVSATAAAPTTETPQAKSSSARQARRERAFENKRQRRQEWLLVGGVLLITAFAFFNSLDGQFVYDDRLQIMRNPTIKQVGNIPRMFVQSVWQFLNEADKAAAGPYYRPLFNIALIVNYALFGLQSFGWHLFSLLVHLAVVFMVYRLARQWALSREVALAAALLFGLHPAHSESVAWIAALPDPLAAVFILSSLLLYERHYHGERRSRAALVVSIALAFGAMLSKEVAIAFSVFLVARELLERTPGESLKSSALDALRRAAPYFAVIVLYIVMRYAVLGFLRQDDATAAQFTQWNVLMTIPSVLLRYARLLFAPYPLAVVYGNKYVESVADPRFWGAALAVAVLLGASAWLVRRSPTGRRALAFVVIFILPVLNLKAFRPQESLLHDRYLYLPSVGFCILIAMAIDWLAARSAERRWQLFATATAVVALVLFVLTFNQNLMWQNEAAMTDNALRVTPNWPFMHNYIGAYAFEQQRYTDAERAYQEALSDDPNYYDSLSNLGDVYRVQGKLNDAEQMYLRAIAAGAPYADTHYNLGVVYTSQNRLPDAEQALLKALEIEPSKTDARYNLGWVYDNEGKPQQAEQAYAETLNYKPGYPEPRINLGVLLTKQGRFKEALDQLVMAQRYAPDHPVMLYALGDVYYRLARYDEAIATFNQLTRREPQHRLAYTALGLCYEAKGDKEQARQNYQRAIEVAPNDVYTATAREHLAKL